jgi:hypothetical protein
MTEGKALVLVGLGTVLLSAGIDVVLLKMHAGGTALAVGLVLVLCLCSVVTNQVMGHYESLKERHRREEILLR